MRLVGSAVASALAAARRTALGPATPACSAAMAVASFAAQAVVGNDVFALRGQRFDLLSGQGIDASIAFDDKHPFAGRLQFAVGQCLEQRGGSASSSDATSAADGGNLLVAFAEAQACAQGLRHRSSARAGRLTGQQQNMTSEAKLRAFMVGP